MNFIRRLFPGLDEGISQLDEEKLKIDQEKLKIEKQRTRISTVSTLIAFLALTTSIFRLASTQDASNEQEKNQFRQGAYTEVTKSLVSLSQKVENGQTEGLEADRDNFKIGYWKFVTTLCDPEEYKKAPLKNWFYDEQMCLSVDTLHHLYHILMQDLDNLIYADDIDPMMGLEPVTTSTNGEPDLNTRIVDTSNQIFNIFSRTLWN